MTPRQYLAKLRSQHTQLTRADARIKAALASARTLADRLSEEAGNDFELVLNGDDDTRGLYDEDGAYDEDDQEIIELIENEYNMPTSEDLEEVVADWDDHMARLGKLITDLDAAIRSRP